MYPKKKKTMTKMVPINLLVDIYCSTIANEKQSNPKKKSILDWFYVILNISLCNILYIYIFYTSYQIFFFFCVDYILSSHLYLFHHLNTSSYLLLLSFTDYLHYLHFFRWGSWLNLNLYSFIIHLLLKLLYGNKKFSIMKNLAIFERSL